MHLETTYVNVTTPKSAKKETRESVLQATCHAILVRYDDATATRIFTSDERLN